MSLRGEGEILDQNRRCDFSMAPKKKFVALARQGRGFYVPSFMKSVTTTMKRGCVQPWKTAFRRSAAISAENPKEEFAPRH